jgi:cell division septation protein DedD
MENRLKERLTGAVILVALIVALVPEMFRGQNGGGQAKSASSSSGEGPPVRTYTIDLSNNPKRSGPLQSANETAPATAPTPAAVAAPPATSAPPSPPAPTPTPASSSPAPAPSASPARVAPKPAAAAPKPAAAAGTWNVQLGLFSKRENAERMMSEAKSKGFNVTLSSVDAKGQFHVLVTGLTDRNAAQAMVQKLKAENLPAAAVAP